MMTNSSRRKINVFAFLVVGGALGFSTGSSNADSFSDPNPPKVHEVKALKSPLESKDFDELTYYLAPKALSPEATTADWPRFLGPTDNAKTPESHLLDEFPKGGLKKVWEMEKGTGYTSPVIVGDKLVFFDRVGDEEVITCHNPETGRKYWSFSYAVEYSDRYGFSNGPRASAVIDSSKIYTLGVTSHLTCLDLETGTLIWQRSLADEFSLADYFFGHGCCPLVHSGKVIVPMGTEEGMSVGAFDQNTGELVWGTKHEWNAAYASPIATTLQGKDRIIVFAGGESEPPTGGLLSIDPETGDLDDAYPWRANKYESVNGSTPVAVGDNQVFISDAYQIGGIMLKMNEEMKWEEMWRAPDFGLHWNTPLLLGNHLYGFRGRNEPDAYLAAYNIDNGEQAWMEDPEWIIQTPTGRDYRMKFFRGSLLHADDRTYALGELGSFAILKLTPEGVELVDRTELFYAYATWSLPVIHRGLLYISQHDADPWSDAPPRLICYDLRK
ncbi:MAG: hypothetical protein CMO55_02125 [Verrucomicrobiales bacterium]|nr:hypothetical protein [Verrucomicrobiales bacterium]